MKDLKPCPFCGESELLEYQHVGTINVVCQACGALGPDFETTLDGAAEVWNDRVNLETDKNDGSSWQPIKTAPKDGMRVLLKLRDSDVPHSGYYKVRYGWRVAWDDHDLSDPDGPTHWMPLPEPPGREGA